MKIFNWMHRKLHPGVIKYSQVSHKKDVSGGDHEEVEKREVLLDGVMEKEALLLHDVLNGAILSIGTLGRDDCCFLPQFYSIEGDDGVLVMPAAEKEENIVPEEAEEREEVQVKETAAPAFMAASEPAAAATLAVVESVKFKAQEELEKKLQPEMAMQADSAGEAERIQELPLLKEDRERRERGRTTLADLFAADHSFMAVSSSPAEMNANKGGVSDRVKLKQHATANCSEKKKTEKNKKEEKWTSDTIKANNSNSSSNNRKLQKLVTKMLKKKIHPEIPGAQKTTTACNCKETD